MPHTNRPKCVVCDRAIRNLTIRFLCTNLLRIFVSIEQRKRVKADNAICDSCRLKYIEWKKLMMGHFDHFDNSDQDSSESDDEVNRDDDMVILKIFLYTIC